MVGRRVSSAIMLCVRSGEHEHEHEHDRLRFGLSDRGLSIAWDSSHGPERGD